MARPHNSAAEFYVRIDTYWQGSPDRFVGPFPTRLEAQAEIDRAISAEGSLVCLSVQNADNVRRGIRVHGILSKTQARRVHGLKHWQWADESNVLGMRIPLTTDELFDMEQEQVYA